MSSTYLSLHFHLVFSTKNREPFILPEFRDRTFAYLGGALSGLDCTPVRIGGMSDHVHLLFVLARTLSISKVVEEVKKESSKWSKEHVHPGFYWQNGYGSFSGSPAPAPAAGADGAGAAARGSGTGMSVDALMSTRNAAATSRSALSRRT